MLARSHKPLTLVNHYNFLANGVTAGGNSSSSALRPSSFIPFQLWSQRSLTDDGSTPIPPKRSTSKDSARVFDSEGAFVSKKLFVVSSSKSLSSLNRRMDQHDSSPAGNCLPPKPAVETKQIATPGSGVMEQLDRVKTLIFTWIESLRNLGWKQALIKVKDQMVTGAGALVAPENVERVRQGLIVAWNMSVRAVQSLIYWSRVFLASREYYYLRYYALLLLENAIYYARLGLSHIVEMVRNLKK